MLHKNSQLGAMGVLIAGLTGVLASSLSAQEQANPFATVQDVQTGQQRFARQCSICHGEGATGDGAITSPMPGKVVAVSVEAGQSVSRGQTLVTLEAMKMEHALTAPFDGVVETLSVAAGDQVSEGLVMVRLAPAA